jgi:nucleoside-diphosphate-sugar epimerase
MKILVTGASGFIGSAFAKLAVSRGHQIGGLILPNEQIPLSLSLSPSDGERVSGRTGEGTLTWIRGSLAELPWREIETFRPDACVHFAWIATPGVYLESPENERHLEWSLNLVRQLKQLGLGYFLGVGTCIEYQITAAPLHEDRTPTDPTTRYSRCKNALRETLAAEAQEDGSRFGWGRVFYPYGVGEHPARLCSSVLQKLRAGEKIELKTPHSRKDYIYIDDLAAAIVLTVERQFVGIINWGTGTGISVREIADTAARLLGRTELVTNAPQLAPDPFDYVVADNQKLRQLGWQPAYSLEAGLKRMLAANQAAA